MMTHFADRTSRTGRWTLKGGLLLLCAAAFAEQPAIQQAVRFNLFQLAQASARASLSVATTWQLLPSGLSVASTCRVCQGGWS